MTQRHFVETPITGAQAMLAGAEAHHLLHVMRRRVGDEVALFDGSGREFVARIERLGRSDVELHVIQRHEISRELSAPLIVGAALPKGDRQRVLVEKLVELGVARLVPLETERGVAAPTEGALVRLRRSVIEASKQCGRNRLMEIAGATSLAQFLAAPVDGAARWIADVSPGATPVWDAAAGLRDDSVVFAAVGPEGGFAPDEAATAAAAGWCAISLGSRTLRVETAAVAVAALVAARQSHELK